MSSMNKFFSSIDIGSNGIRMMIAEVIFENQKPVRLNEVKKIRTPVRLGKDVFLDQPISEQNIVESIETFLHFKNLNQKYQISKCRAVATSALREAKNKEDFINRIEKTSGIKIELIDGLEEARLIFLAISKEVSLQNVTTVLIDVGGGSVEITFCENGKSISSQSFPIGTVRILDHLIKRKLTEPNLKVVFGDFITPIAKFVANTPTNDNVAFAVGTGGNLECMSRLKLDLLKKTTNTYLTLSELVEIYEKLSHMSIEERVHKLKLRPDRADVILPAILTVKTIMRQAQTQKILIPCVGLRNGVLWSMLE